jgi:hypothetical protein
MRIRHLGQTFTLISALAFSSLLFGQTRPAPSASKPAATPDQNMDQKMDQKFDPRDLSGPWLGDERTAKIQNFAIEDQTIPEPPLTEWARQHLLYKSISHNPTSGTLMPGSDKPGFHCPNGRGACFSVDSYGVIANVPEGEYPGRDCEPLSTPAMYDYPRNGSMELIFTREGDRVFQFFEYHREWRTFWMNREHPKDLDLTYEGDSTAHWDGNDLMVDTIAYNDKTMISQGVGHRKSDAFRLEERFHRVDRDHMVIDMTYYDPKAWGDKNWPGFRKYFHRVAKEDFMEFICSPRAYAAYDNVITHPAEKGAPGK